MTIKKAINIAGKEFSLETGDLAKQATSSVLARYGDTVVLATVVMGRVREDLNYFPLTVDYVERLYAGGKISTSRFVKRERMPRDAAILNGRLIDHAIRPLFPKDFGNEVQIVVTVLSIDQDNDPAVLALNAVSAALTISKVPWDGPLAAVRVGYLNQGEAGYILNPDNGKEEESLMEFIACGYDKKIMMMELEAQEISEEILTGAVEFAFSGIAEITGLINSLKAKAGVEKYKFEAEKLDEEMVKEIEKSFREKIETIIKDAEMTWHEATGTEIVEEVKKEFAEKASAKLIGKIFNQTAKEVMREYIFQEGKRIDGRKFEEIRPISMQVSILPRTHGSAIFNRGATQTLSVVTLGSPTLEQLIESLEGEETKRFMHHYNFPPYSTGETGRMGYPGRREIGHGALGEKGLNVIIPLIEKFPYTIRVVSEVLGADASTSMAAVCSSSLAMMDAGVPISAPAGGVTVGLVTQDGDYRLLLDMRAAEDYFGEMDLKVIGTANGITGIQMEVKNSGVDLALLTKAFKMAGKGRLEILNLISQTLPGPRPTISQYAPKIVVLHIETEKIGEVIGPGGRIIRKIIAETGATVDVEDDGAVTISGATDEIVQKAVAWIDGLTREVKPGELYDGTVKRIMPFGAFVEVLPGKEGLVHVSKMGTGYVQDPGDVVAIGQTVRVRVDEIDEMGRVNLSMYGENAPAPQAPRTETLRPAPRHFGPGAFPRRDFDRREPRGGGRERRGGRRF